MQKDIDDLKSQNSQNHSRTNKTIKVQRKQLILPEDDMNCKHNNNNTNDNVNTVTPSYMDDTTEKGNNLVESNKDITHAMSFQDIANTLASNSVDNRT